MNLSTKHSDVVKEQGASEAQPHCPLSKFALPNRAQQLRPGTLGSGWLALEKTIRQA
jgi:hypothetical protein